MDSSAIWLLILSISTPVAGVIGFAIQLRQIRKTRLENEKLLLEIAALKASAEASEKRVVLPTVDEVLRFGRDEILLSRRPPDDPAALDSKFEGSQTDVSSILLVTLVVLVACYAVYDVVRLVMWLISFF